MITETHRSGWLLVDAIDFVLRMINPSGFQIDCASFELTRLTGLVKTQEETLFYYSVYPPFPH